MKAAPFTIGDKVGWVGARGKSYTGTILRMNNVTLAVLTDLTQNVMSFSLQAAKAARLALIK